MKQSNLGKIALTAYCAITAVLSLLVIAVFAANYGNFAENVPVYLAPWGGSWGDKAKSVFYVMRMPVMALCLQGMLLGAYPDRIEDYSDGVYRWLRALMLCLSLITTSQLSLNPLFTFMNSEPVMRGIVLCATLALGLAGAVYAYLKLRTELKPMCDKQHVPVSLMLDMIVKGCKRRRPLMIAAVAAFMVLLVIPSL